MADTTSDRSDTAPHAGEWPDGLLNTVAAQSAILFYIADLGNGARTHFVSPNIERITGDAPAVVLDRPRYWRRHIHPDDLARYAECVARLAADGSSATVQYRFRTADGNYRWFRDEIRRETGEAWHKDDAGRGKNSEDGKSGGTSDVIVGCMVDVTAEMERLADYHDITSIHTTIVDAAPFAIVVIDVMNRIVEFNAAAERMFQYRQDQVLGRSLSETIVPEKYRAQHEAGLRRWREYVDHQRRPARVEAEAQRADGSLFPVSIVVAPTVWREGTVFVAVITDLSEQVRAETERRQADQLLRDAVAALSEGFALFDADNKLVMCNDRYRQIHSGSEDLLVPGSDWVDLMRIEAERGMYVAAVGRAEEWVEDRVEARIALRSNLEYEQSDGRWFIGSNQKTGDGGFVVTLNEITERKEREREVQRAHEVLEDAIECLSEGFALWDPNDRLVMCNQTYRDFNELCGDILKPGVKWLDLMRAGAERGQYAAAIGRIDEWLEQSIRDRKDLRANHEYEISDGRWCIGSNRRTRQGGIVVTRIDITERKQMENALQESEAFIRRVLDACPVAVEMVRADTGALVYASPASRQLFGRDSRNGEILARDAFVNAAQYDVYVKDLTDHGRVSDREMELKTADGETFWASVSGRCIEYRGDAFIVSTFFDLTERIATEAELARQREALHQSEKLTALGSLLAGVAHELNNPLTVVIGRAMMLEEALADTPQADSVAKLRTAAERCSKIVQTFLALARQSEPTRQSVRIDRVVEAAMEIVSYGLNSDSVEVVIDLDETLPEIAADASQLIQVFSNLFTNARQALADHPMPRTIRVSGRHDATNNTLVVDVADNGPGIAKENLSRIFDPFFSTKRSEQGTGLGLSVSMGLVRAHHGSIDVQVPDDGGTVFSVRLPITATATTPSVEVAEAPAPSDRMRILIVEDEVEIAAMLSEFLEPLGYQVVVAETGRIALDRLRDDAFDLVMTDLRMPDLDGRQLYEEMEVRYPELARRTIFVTGDTLSGYFETFLKDTGRPVIEKPFTPEDIRDIVATELARGNGQGSG